MYPSTIASQTPLFRGFSRQEHSGGLPFPPARDLPDPGIKSVSPALMSGGGLPTWWLFSLRRPSSGVYGLYGRVNSNLQEGFCQGGPSRTPVACAPFLWQAPTDPHLHGGPSSTSRWLWFSLLWGRCSFPLGFIALQDWNLCFPQSCGSPVIKSHWPSRPDSMRIPVPLLYPQAGKPDLGFRTFRTASLVLLFSSMWVTHVMGVGSNFTVTAPLLVSHFFFVFGHGISLFLVGSVSSCQWLSNS